MEGEHHITLEELYSAIDDITHDHEGRKKLLEWEKHLTPYFNGQLRIIGEIPLHEQDLREIADAVHQMEEDKGISFATKFMESEYPFTYLCLLSGFSAINTEVNFWQAFADYIQIDRSRIINYKWHQLFVRLAEAYKLLVFNFDDTNTPYVITIRFHGGIPYRCLADYFERIIEPAVIRPDIRELEYQQRLDHLVKTARYVSKPVLNFLEYSGDLGLQFF